MELTKGMKKEYENLYSSMEIWNTGILEHLVRVIFKERNRKRYEKVEKATGIPWMMIATIHYMEASLNFKRNLHNGQEWYIKTTIIPKGKGPFNNWVESAIDAMTDLRIDLIKKSIDYIGGIGAVAYTFENHNGWGYRKYRGIYSPYLWASSNHYKKGKYASDGKYDPNLVSKQTGAMVLYKSLNDKKEELLEEERQKLIKELEKVPDPLPEPKVIIPKKLSKWEKIKQCMKGWF